MILLLPALLGCGTTPKWVENKALTLEKENFELREDLDALEAEVAELRAEVGAMRTQTHQALHEAGVTHAQ